MTHAQPPLHGAAVEIRDVSKRFGASTVLDRIDLSIGAGEFVSLVGPSGCGKTTLLRILAGLETPDVGRVRIGGMDMTEVPAHKRSLNTVFQNYALFPHLSVRENIEFGLRSRRIEDPARVDETMRLARVDDLQSRDVSTLSGGQRQRVALARAIVNRPSVLVLDEPMSALDAKLREQVREELRALRRRTGITFILVTHDQDEAMCVSDRMIVMNAGRIEQIGSPRELYESPRTAFVADFIGGANILAVTDRNGEKLTCALGATHVNEQPDAVVALAVRAEHVRLSQTRSNSDRRVRDVQFRGDRADVILEPDGLRVRTVAESAPEVGTAVEVSADPQFLKPLYA